jgi:hypothetical protein
VIGLGIGNRHRQTAYLQLPWPFRIALLTWAVVTLICSKNQKYRLVKKFDKFAF